MTKTERKISPWKKLALTSEETEGMPKDKLQVHLSEQVTTPMPWLLSWIGRHWKKLLIFFIVLIVIICAIIGVAFAISASELSFGDWFVNVILKGFVWLLDFIFIKLVGWAWIVFPLSILITIYLARKLVKRDVIVISRYGTGRKKSYTIAATDEGGYVLGVWRQNLLGNIFFGMAKANISNLTWEYIQQNSRLCSHKLLGLETLEYKLLYVLPEEYSKEPILKRINQELTLNPRCLIRQKDAEEILLHNIGKKKGEQIDNNKILYNLTEDLHNQLEEIGDLSVKVRSVPRSKIQRYIKAMTPETTELFYDTYNLLKDKLEDLTPFDSIEAELEAMSKEKTKETDEIE